MGHMPLMNQIRGAYAPSTNAPDENQSVSAPDEKIFHGGDSNFYEIFFFFYILYIAQILLCRMSKDISNCYS